MFCDLPVSDRFYHSADFLRDAIVQLFGANGPERVILSPGILIAISSILSMARHSRVLLTSSEYYLPSHFPGKATFSCSPEQIPGAVQQHRPDVVVASVVSWAGDVLGLGEAFAEVRRLKGLHCPLLFADYSHAGAIGFPSMQELNADVVCGDPEKWVTSRSEPSPVAFCWIRDADLFNRVAPVFRPFFLASTGRVGFRAARWVEPQSVETVAELLRDTNINRDVLTRQAARNLEFARQLARAWHVQDSPPSSILWLDSAHLERDPLFMAMIRAGLVWKVDDRHARVLCRQDIIGDLMRGY